MYETWLLKEKWKDSSTHVMLTEDPLCSKSWYPAVRELGQKV